MMTFGIHEALRATFDEALARSPELAARVYDKLTRALARLE